MCSVDSFVKALADVNTHGPGPRTLKLFKVREPSSVGDYDHVTNWTQPFGQAVQFSLLNASGRFDDTSTDHNR